MESKVLIFLVLLNILSSANISVNAFVQSDREVGNPAFDPSFYEDLLDPELCEKQLSVVRNDAILRVEFVESGLRIPRSILTGNIVDLGNYHQCLGIRKEAADTFIEGKYCTISVPTNQELNLPEWPSLPDLPDWIIRPEYAEFNPNLLQMKNETIKHLKLFDAMNAGVRATNGVHNMRSAIGDLGDLNIRFTLAVCVPKACTTREGIAGLLFDADALGFEYEDRTCRVNNDKPWVAGDYVAMVTFSLIVILTTLSTLYDLYSVFSLKRDSKSINTICRSFSLYTNTRRLTTFVSSPGTLECLDGIRSLSMIWVIVGHTFYTLPVIMNNLDALDWQTSFSSVWISSAPITVDTFFMLSGILLVYTSSGKFTGMKLLKTLHVFYLNRFLRMFPLLAAAVLAQASVFHKISDGPMWNTVAANTNHCRTNWWVTMLYIQNFINPGTMCLGHSWYLAIDMQLHILSPLVLFWVLSKKKKVAWSVLASTLTMVLVAATTYNFIMKLPGGVIVPARQAESMDYFTRYYVNTLTRASPFFVGMIFGYLLHIRRDKKLQISRNLSTLMWFCALSMTSLAIYATEPMKDINWDNQTVDSLVNSFMRPMWATGLGWIIFACVQGYGGPINWFLSLRLWKLPSRISYAMYLFHFPILYVIYGTKLAPFYFTVSFCLYNFMSQLVISLLIGFIVTLVIDSPFSTLFKLMFGGGSRRPQKPETDANKKADAEIYKL